jgi:hypothetical protein
LSGFVRTQIGASVLREHCRILTAWPTCKDRAAVRSRGTMAEVAGIFFFSVQ